MKHKLNISAKFILLFGVIILMIGSLFYYGINKFQEEILRKEISDDLLLIANAKLKNLDRTLYEKFFNAYEASRKTAPLLKKNNQIKQIKEELDRYLRSDTDIISAAIYDMNRTKVASTSPAEITATQHPIKEYWPEIYAGNDYVISASITEEFPEAVFYIAKRIMIDQETIGVLDVRIPVERMNEWLDMPLNRGDEKFYKEVIMDRAGLTLFTNHKKERNARAMDDDYHSILYDRKLHNHISSYFTEDYEEEPELLIYASETGYKNFKGNDWILKIELPTSDVFAPIAKLNKKMFIYLSAFFGLASLVVYFVLLYMVIKPINLLNAATDEIGKGNLRLKLPIKSEDEIGHLTSNFNTMATSLAHYKEDLEHLAKQATNRAVIAESEIINISEKVQHQIGQELHDDLGQKLTGAAFMSEVLFQNLKSSSHPDLVLAAKITTLINQSVSTSRKLAHNLYPVELNETSFFSAIKGLSQKVSEIYNIKCIYTENNAESLEDLPLDHDTKIHLYRIAQEAVSNAIKHGKATKISLNLIVTPSLMTLEIIDNGKGFENPASQKIDQQSGLGLRTMKYRASLIGADLTITSQKEKGSTITITLPLNHEI